MKTNVRFSFCFLMSYLTTIDFPPFVLCLALLRSSDSLLKNSIPDLQIFYVDIGCDKNTILLDIWWKVMQCRHQIEFRCRNGRVSRWMISLVASSILLREKWRKSLTYHVNSFVFHFVMISSYFFRLPFEITPQSCRKVYCITQSIFHFLRTERAAFQRAAGENWSIIVSHGPAFVARVPLGTKAKANCQHLVPARIDDLSSAENYRSII